MSTMIQEAVKAIIDVIYPPLCVCCKKPHHRTHNTHICNECYSAIKRHIPPFCLLCGRDLQQLPDILRGICASCRDKKYFFDRAWSLCRYEGYLKNLIHDFKYKHKLHYKIIFEQLLKEFIQTYKAWMEIEVIIPIPLHAVRLREREYNQSALIAELLNGLLHKPVYTGCLKRIRNTKAQINLDEQDRMHNVNGCFQVNNGELLRAKSILLVDDVFTTGATLSEAARRIRAYRPKTIEVLTLAS